MSFNLQILKNFKEIAILFSSEFKNSIQEIYDTIKSEFPEKEIYLIPSKSILCSAKTDKYESYVLLGIECPLHKFENAIQFKIDFKLDESINGKKIEGKIFTDSIYNLNSNLVDFNCCKNLINSINPLDQINSINPLDQITVITNNQAVLNFYSKIYENINLISQNNLQLNSKVNHLMKEHSNSLKLKNKKMIGVVFTSKIFENQANFIVNLINNEFSRAYKIFLKDISYERMISIDNIDCIILIDCPLFEFNFNIHIPVISFESALENIKSKNEIRNELNQNNGINNNNNNNNSIVNNHLVEIMENRWFKGVVFTNEEEDMKIYQGRKGIASEYEKEGEIETI